MKAPNKYYPFPIKMKPKPKKKDHELSRHERGYDNNWVKLRNNHIRKNPLCKNCLDNSIVAQATDVDHIIPFRGLDDPLRLDPNNLQSLCKRCHSRKTKKQ